MLGKLMKYEFMAMGRVFLPLFGALIAISIINSVFGIFGLDTPAGIGIAVSVLLIIGIAVVTFVLIIQRFWLNLLSSEGYLMMTLPVSTDRIILSKLITASVLSVVSSLVVLLSIMLMTITNISFADVAEGIRYGFGLIPFTSPQKYTLVIQFLIASVLAMFTNILLLYACMSLSMISNKHRWLVAIGAYIALTTAVQIIATVLFAVGAATGMFGMVEKFMMSFPTFGQVQLIMLIIILFTVILGAVFYLITRYMLKNRLNLQ